MAGLLKRLQEKEGFSETERIVADYMLEHFRELANFSTRQLAKNTFTSSAAIVRFSQKLGFEGYADFKIRFLAEMMQQTSEPKERFFSEKDTIPDIIDKIMHMGSGAIKETHTIITRIMRL
ncbi:MAG: MurR/RpiR family transcriptional regulator [Selenomonadaceae bacterium]|nr:MurR/RpiR family transcriptional regulator [Selenomonadaceae bacterium]